MSSNEHQEWYRALLATDCPSGHLGRVAIDGYLFAIHTLPQPPGISDWLDGIFHHRPPASLPHPISAGLWQLGSEVAAAVRQESYRLPACCHQDNSALRQWQTGFSHGLDFGPDDWEHRLAATPRLDPAIDASARLYAHLIAGRGEPLDAVALRALISDYQNMTNTLRSLTAPAADQAD